MYESISFSKDFAIKNGVFAAIVYDYLLKVSPFVRFIAPDNLAKSLPFFNRFDLGGAIEVLRVEGIVRIGEKGAIEILP